MMIKTNIRVKTGKGNAKKEGIESIFFSTKAEGKLLFVGIVIYL
ncbi:hypothetical protein [Proteus sp. TJ1640]|nr:hypothetical protein [Proteus sp. TJ1640]